MPTEEEEIINLIAQELMAGKSVATVAGELEQAGLPRDEAYTVVNAVAQQLARRGAPSRGGYAPPPRRGGFPWVYFFLIIAIGVLLYVIFYSR